MILINDDNIDKKRKHDNSDKSAQNMRYCT